MATVTLYESNRYGSKTTALAQYYGLQTSEVFEVISSLGTLLYEAIGHDFTYGSNGFFRTGTITEEYYFTASGGLAGVVTGLDLSVAERNRLLSIGTSNGALEQYTYRGDDTFIGSSGDDSFSGTGGSDSIDGGDGSDVISYDAFDGNVVIGLAEGQAVTISGTSTIVDIEDVIGSRGDDTIGGDAGANVIQGLAGNDYIDGRDGFDTASYLDARFAVVVDLAAGTATGGSGNDTLISIERVVGSRFNDTLTGSSRDETFSGSFGNDTMDGGGGKDTVEYDNVGRGVRVDLTAGTASGGGGDDTLASIENVKGSLFADTLLGSRAANVLRGGDGNDVLSGRGGADALSGGNGRDLLAGGTGADTLAGGAGKDTFRFDTALGSTNIDRITDFRPAYDKIQLDNAVFTALGATGALGTGAFKAIATGGAIDASDRVVYNKTTGALYYDANGSTNGLSDSIQFATLAKDLALTAGDFLVI